MIVPMTKYTFVAYHRDHRAFVESLRDLGLVDITIRNWEPSDADRVLLSESERYRHLIERLKQVDAAIKENKEASVAEPLHFASATEAVEFCQNKIELYDTLNARKARLLKEATESKVWGDFTDQTLSNLESAGVSLRFFTCYLKEFEASIEAWSADYTVEEICRENGNVYFVIVGDKQQTININAQELKAPTSSYKTLTKQADEVAVMASEVFAELGRCVGCIALFEQQRADISSKLHLNQVIDGSEEQAEGTIIIMEGYATTESCEAVDAMIDNSEVFAIKERPNPEDEVPVLLKNNRFARLFELIGSFYALPKYGTTDLTPFFAPFYMLFFGFCLGDGGYGLIFVLTGLGILLKGGEKLRQAGWLTLLCGSTTVLFGLMTGSVFGIQLAELEIFAGIRDKFVGQNDLFSLALAIGMVQIIFGMIIKIAGICRMYGYKYAFATVGWVLLLCSTTASALLPNYGVESFSMGSTPHLICVGVALFMMLFMNSPGKNPLVNLGAGLWNTYNNLTGFMSDILSYIRLFAIGLSGGILALVFNELAFGLSPDIPVVKQLVVIIILLIGHGINLFMSTLSAFVHPLRLTFVEFYNNAGFEASMRAFKPLKK